MKYKDKWDSTLLYNICGTYLDNQTEKNSLQFIRNVELFKEKYVLKEEK
jgi:hypothetical protein